MGFSPDAVTAEADSSLHRLYSDLTVIVSIEPVLFTL
jgi:hypothetical protein